MGDWATWATALFTGAALVAAVVAVKKTGGMLQLEQKRDRDRDAREEEQRRAAEQAVQADSVAAWHVPSAEPMQHAARIINNSPLPVWNVKVEFIGPDGTVRTAVTLPVVAPGTEDVPWPWELREPVQRGQDASAPLVFTESPSEFAVTVEFRDVTGRVWKRDQNGILRQTGVIVFGELATVLPSLDVQMQGQYRPPSNG